MREATRDIAKLSEIARHWGLTTETTEKILRGHGAVPAEEGPRKYHWRDVWEIEGAAYIPSAEVEAYKAPLLKPAVARRRFYPKLKPRALRERAAKGTAPGIKLGTEWRFREADLRKAAQNG